jgi:hypothetical protein
LGSLGNGSPLTTEKPIHDSGLSEAAQTIVASTRIDCFESLIRILQYNSSCCWISIFEVRNCLENGCQ